MADTSFVPGDPQSLGFDAQRLARVGPAMQAYVDDQRVPNLVTLVARKGKIAHLEARGVLDFDTGAPAGTDSLFRMYSNTKPIAGVALCVLYERGLLTPDDPVSRFLPEYADIRVQRSAEPMFTDPPKRPLTIRDCITNTTGFTNSQLMPSFYRQQYREQLEILGWTRAPGEPASDSDTDKPDNRERARAMAEIPFSAHPGERFVYHVGYPVLTAVLEEAAGQNMEDFLRENIFDPLGMVDSGFYLKDGALDRYGANYVPREENGEVRLAVAEKAETSEKTVGPKREFEVGGSFGGILTTATDYARFGQMLLNGGELDGSRIIGRKTVEMMIGNHTGDMEIPMTGPGFHWGLGVATYHGRNRFPLIRSVGTYGWGGAAGTTYFADPAEELMGVCLTQVMNAGMMPNNNYQEEFQRLVYQALA
jgi:CubicO group peptidase (beta-lactamase class C family)